MALKILGADISINGSGFTVMNINDDFTVKDFTLHGFTNTIIHRYKSSKLEVLPLPNDYSNYPYFYKGQLIYDLIKDKFENIDYVSMEDYSMNSKGLVFAIADFTSCIKNIFYRQRTPIKLLPPNSVKSFATSNGGADKVLIGMNFKSSIFAEMCDPHLFELPEYESPSADMIDSFQMANLLRCELCYKATGKFPSDMGVKLQGAMEAIVTGKKTAKSQPTIMHPLIIFGQPFKTPKKPKKPKKEKKIKEPKPVKEKKIRVPKEKKVKEPKPPKAKKTK